MYFVLKIYWERARITKKTMNLSFKEQSYWAFQTVFLIDLVGSPRELVVTRLLKWTFFLIMSILNEHRVLSYCVWAMLMVREIRLGSIHEIFLFFRLFDGIRAVYIVRQNLLAFEKKKGLFLFILFYSEYFCKLFSQRA